MQIFDVNDRGTCMVDRKLSNTPLQALSMLNDPQFVEASRALAEKLLITEPNCDTRLEKAFRLLTGRRPDDTEQEMLTDFFQDELTRFQADTAKALAYLENGELDSDQTLPASEIAALGVVVNAILNTSEAYTQK
ncbi:MAG: DUF1553 domain-containing protein [Bacteroidota bacterium]